MESFCFIHLPNIYSVFELNKSRLDIGTADDLLRKSLVYSLVRKGAVRQPNQLRAAAVSFRGRVAPPELFIPIESPLSHDDSNKVFKERPAYLRFPDKLWHEFIEKINQGNTSGQARYGHYTPYPQDRPEGTGEIGQKPFGYNRINVVVENSIQAHEDQGVLSQPDDCLLVWCGFSKE